MSKQYREWDGHVHLINPDCPRPETLAEALAAGYETADSTYQRGYLSRRNVPTAAETAIGVAGGSRAGWLYYNGPAYNTTQYYLRHYLFQPTHPRGVRQKAKEEREALINFNPRTHEGCDKKPRKRGKH